MVNGTANKECCVGAVFIVTFDLSSIYLWTISRYVLEARSSIRSSHLCLCYALDEGLYDGLFHGSLGTIWQRLPRHMISKDNGKHNPFGFRLTDYSCLFLPSPLLHNRFPDVLAFLFKFQTLEKKMESIFTFGIPNDFCPFLSKTYRGITFFVITQKKYVPECHFAWASAAPFGTQLNRWCSRRATHDTTWHHMHCCTHLLKVSVINGGCLF